MANRRYEKRINVGSRRVGFTTAEWEDVVKIVLIEKFPDAPPPVTGYPAGVSIPLATKPDDIPVAVIVPPSEEKLSPPEGNNGFTETL